MATVTAPPPDGLVPAYGGGGTAGAAAAGRKDSCGGGGSGGDRRPLSLTVNGRRFEVPPEAANAPLADFIRGYTPYKSVKVACGEGGCGACTVAVLEEREGGWLGG
ncbi:hypothetical protein GPECTOR_7g963 [Gonium pectorale]|uniref:2Fe-2S ferredoxin-type domain-containing protein n=1 Tax=Gonium pectorale TaxID=33097 RepID=A0A150GUT3_GONPE|nr:hypothetical protein GPECTOR_7g963 [Gonium pectorale]|eukprot:KXZ53513.1 hypothetical protein GPECTOR_7g963 [Gonium pectorale]